MDFLGLIGSYSKQRPLTDLERNQRLDQKRRLDVQPHYQLSVIRMSSAYFESVDKWYAWKGVLTAVGSAIICIFIYGIFRVGFGTDGAVWSMMSPDDKIEQLVFTLAIALISTPLIWLGAWLIKKESFAYTHYPIRFDRNGRAVHVFRTNGTMLSIPWDQIFFTLGHLQQWNEWEVRGHILEPDGVTVNDTFALSYTGSINAVDIVSQGAQSSSEDFVRAHWEFVRRYMEEGPQAVSSQVQFCMPVDECRESFRVGMERIFANFAGAPFPIYWMMFPFCLTVSLFRWFAMRTSKIPTWSADIEASCRIEVDDPYAIKGAPTGDRLAVFPEAAGAAGICFCAPPITPKTAGRAARRT
jgi:hypothetical protein